MDYQGEALSDEWIIVKTQDEINAISESITGNGFVTVEDGKLKCSGKQPSTAHTWNGKKWVLDKAKQAELAMQEFSQKSTVLLKTVLEKADVMKAALFADYPQMEIESFYRQEREARAYIEDKTAPCEMLTAIATMRHITVDLLAEKVIEKADKIAVITGKIIGTRQHFEDLISVAKTMDELVEIENAVAQWSLNNE